MRGTYYTPSSYISIISIRMKEWKEAIGPHVERSVVWLGDNGDANAFALLLSLFCTYFDITFIKEGVIFDRELRQKLHTTTIWMRNRLLNCIQHEHTGVSTILNIW